MSCTSSHACAKDGIQPDKNKVPYSEQRSKKKPISLNTRKLSNIREKLYKPCEQYPFSAASYQHIQHYLPFPLGWDQPLKSGTGLAKLGHMVTLFICLRRLPSFAAG